MRRLLEGLAEQGVVLATTRVPSCTCMVCSNQFLPAIALILDKLGAGSISTAARITARTGRAEVSTVEERMRSRPAQAYDLVKV
jgi:hypothetical protein